MNDHLKIEVNISFNLPTIEDAEAEYSQWSQRLKPKRFALLGGEPLFNPQIAEHIELARKHWPDSELMLVTNGFFLHRFPNLPIVLRENRCRLEVSQHGTHEAYAIRFRKVRELVWRWQQDFHGVQIRIRQSHEGWMRQYNVVNGKPMPFDSQPAAAFKICMQRTCAQLFQSRLWKCPALAYLAQLESKLRLSDIPEWQLFRDYQACPPSATNEELQTFLETQSIPQCGLCPSKRTAFVHPDPMQRSPLK